MSILIGVCDDEIPVGSGEGLTSWTSNKIGSHPDWMHTPAHRPLCQLCSQTLHLVVQVYCPLTDSVYHRTIYVFACIGKSCQGKAQSWYVCRSQICDIVDQSQSEPEAKQEDIGMATSDWCEEAEDWGDDSETTVAMAMAPGEDIKLKKDKENINFIRTASDSLDGTISAVESLKLDNPCEVEEHDNCFMGYYVNVFEEDDSVKRGELTKHEKRLLMDYQQREGVDLSSLEEPPQRSRSGAAEKYEKSEIKHGDRIFHKFHKRISTCPEQCLRYEWQGQPLLMTTNHLLQSVPPCQYCGGQRTFEFQLMPGLVSVLKVPGTAGTPIDFGTVYIYTCRNSCWTDTDTVKYKEEFLIVQQDPDLKYFPNQLKQ